MSKTVSNYYTHSHWLYSIFCFSSKSLGMHYGFWTPETKNREEAILNENQVVIDIGKITQNSHVLDLGCGIGGTAQFIAKKTGAKVTGISITESQIALATKLAARKGLAKFCDFMVMDFMHMKFQDNSFDVVYAIESLCYAEKKETLLQEIFRVLKPGGTLVVMDGYVKIKPRNQAEQKMQNGIIWGFKLARMVSGNMFLSQMKK